MQCPNCGKEAINVNGRYVCLDCGIELNPNNPSPTGTIPEPTSGASIDNHSQLPTGSVPPIAGYNPAPLGPTNTATTASAAASALSDPEPDLNQSPTPAAPTPAIIPGPTDPTSLGSAEVNAADSDAPSLATQPETVIPVVPTAPVTPPVPPAPDPAVTETAAPVAANPAMSYEDAANMVLGESAAPAPSPAPAEVPVTPAVEKPAEPVKDYFVSALNDQNEVPVAPAEGASVLPDFPTGEESVVAPQVTPDALTNPTPAEPVVSDTPTSPEPESYFQPNSFDINNPTPTTDAAVAVTTEPTTEEIPTIAPEVVPEPNVPDENSGMPPVTMPEPAPEVVLPPSEPLAAAGLNLEPEETEIPIKVGTGTPESPLGMAVDPLDTNITDGISAGSVTAENLNPSTPGNFPGSSNIPSTESVFGAPAPSEPEVLPNKKTPLLRILWIFLAIVGLALLIAGGYLGYKTFIAGSKTVESGGESSGEILSISQDVAGVMDESIDLAASFEQKIDFSKATTTNTSLTESFKTPVTLKENWAVDKDGDVSLVATQGQTETKRTYIKADSGTYVFSPETKTWVKVEGSQLNPASIFYPIEPRGGLFYLSRVETMTSEGEDTIDGVKAKKIKIVPKKTALQEMLSTANPTLATAKYNEVNTAGLMVTAWVNSENQVVKVEVSGTIEVDSDLYTGPVEITTSGTYKYATQNVAKP